MHRNIMVLGTASSAGKSLITTALCRVFFEDGYKVSPFKSQNMSLNSFVTKDGLEMGRAQVVQAEACGIEPQIFMNPILLKPNSNNGSQIILHGKAIGNMNAIDYFAFRKNLKAEIEKTYEYIKNNFDICVIEGAGSPAEINLKKDDIVNTGMAKIAGAPCILVADIDKGGVFASIYGTIMLLEEDERALIKGIVINKFRGDVKILEPGLKMLEDLVKVPVLGVMPFIQHNVEDEDRVSDKLKEIHGNGQIKVGVIHLPYMSNFNDFDPLKMYSDITLHFIDNPSDLDTVDMIIIPGSKNTIKDMLFLRNNGFEGKLSELKTKGKIIFGICGGLQMLGRLIKDPLGLEGDLLEIKGLGFLDLETTMEATKKTKQFIGKTSANIEVFNMPEDLEIKGYEIHQGITSGNEKVFLKNTAENLGYFNENVIGTYIHGILDEGDFLPIIIEYLKEQKNIHTEKELNSFKEFKEIEYKKLAQVTRNSLDFHKIYQIMNGEEIDLSY